MEEAAQILEIETFIPLLLQVNMYDVSSLWITLKMLRQLLTSAFSWVNWPSVELTDGSHFTNINGACHW